MRMLYRFVVEHPYRAAACAAWGAFIALAGKYFGVW